MSGKCTNCGDKIIDLGVLSPSLDPATREMCIKCASRMLVKQEDISILFYAFRYALGRMTYASQEVSDYIVKHWDLIDDHTKQIMQTEIRAAIHMGTAGMPGDVKAWQRILAL